MALRGTLKDFGIADILQLIGHQGKSGVLTVRNGDQEVQIAFCEGNVVRAEPSSRQRRDLLGRILVRAEAVSEEQLNRALEMQKRNLKRLGQILIESGVIDRQALGVFTHLQTTETVYRLFVWSSGNYEFTQKEVPIDSEFEPIRAETLLMEGFRQLDEWPGVRRRITGYGITFEKLEDLDALLASSPAAEGGEDDSGEGDFDLGDSTKPSRLKHLGQNERVIYQLTAPERDVQKIIDLSRMGEFETCRALANLIDAGVIRSTQAETKRAPSAEATVGGIGVRSHSRLTPVIVRLAATAGLVLALAFAWRLPGVRPALASLGAARWGFFDTSVQAQLATGHMQRIAEALGIFQARYGQYPHSLQELVSARLLTARDLRFPWQGSYHYVRRIDGSYELTRPLY